jgi:microcystin-dependent protein
MDGYYGQIILYPKNWIPLNWRICDGSVMDTDKNMALAVVLGYSEDSSKFSLPIIDSPHSEYVYIICINGTFPQKS